MSENPEARLPETRQPEATPPHAKQPEASLPEAIALPRIPLPEGGAVQVREIDPLDHSGRASWDQFVFEQSQATLYHLSGWRDVISNALGHQTVLLAAYENSSLVGILPLTVVKSMLFGTSCISMPFLNYGGAVSVTESAERALYDAAVSIARAQQAKQVELRNRFRPLDGHPQKLEKATFILPLQETEEKTFAKFRKATRNRIRKSDDYSLTIERGNHLLDRFYAGFCVAMKEHGTPVLPKQFFRDVQSAFPELVSYYVASKENGIAGVKLAMVWRGTMYQIWGGYPKAYRSMLANYALSWEATRDAIGAGLTACDFGRSTRASGPADFKRHFSCEEYQLFWEYPFLPSGELPAMNPKNKKYEQAIAIWKQLPLALTNLVGPTLSRHLP